VHSCDVPSFSSNFRPDHNLIRFAVAGAAEITNPPGAAYVQSNDMASAPFWGSWRLGARRIAITQADLIVYPTHILYGYGYTYIRLRLRVASLSVTLRFWFWTAVRSGLSVTGHKSLLQVISTATPVNGQMARQAGRIFLIGCKPPTPPPRLPIFATAPLPPSPHLPVAHHHREQAILPAPPPHTIEAFMGGCSRTSLCGGVRARTCHVCRQLRNFNATI
jgi:hypothetical protein